jgi:3-isopropylmalate/(R)-2-methylmalate dehydratase small subunit
MKIEGRVWKFGSDVDTDAIIAARHLNQSDLKELAKHAMARVSERSQERGYCHR